MEGGREIGRNDNTPFSPPAPAPPPPPAEMTLTAPPPPAGFGVCSWAILCSGALLCLQGSGQYPWSLPVKDST